MTVTGEKTAMSRKKASAPVRYLDSIGIWSERVLDFGCGRGDLRFLETPMELWEWDPAHQPNALKNGKEAGDVPLVYFDKVYCGYVLNVMPVAEQIAVMHRLWNHLAPGGEAYIAVRRDVPLEGTSTQWYVSLPYEIVKKNSGYCIYRVVKD